MSDLCDEYGIKPNRIYAWQKVLFDNAETAFHQVGNRNEHNAWVPRDWWLEDWEKQANRGLDVGAKGDITEGSGTTPTPATG